GYYLLAEHYYGAYYRTRFHPSTALTQFGPYPGLAGVQNTIKVQGLAPFEPALVYFGFRPGLDSVGACEVPLLGIEQLAATLVIWPDAAGNAGVKFQLPKELDGRILFSQVLQPGHCRASNTVATYL